MTEITCAAAGGIPAFYATSGGIPASCAAAGGILASSHSAAAVAVALLAAVLALAAAVWNRRRAKRVLTNLDRMLDAAMVGTFAERDFDESLLSAVESKFAHYLAANAVSAQKLQEDKDKIKALIADISHQTKTPVANVLLYTQLLAEQDLSPEGRECSAALENQVEKLRSLIEALVKTSRLETGILALHPKAGPLAPMLEEAVGQFTPKAEEKGISLTLAPTDALAVFDPKWTAEALCNLLDNAVKYTPAGGVITVEAVPYSMFCRVSVTDSGPGIPEAERAKVFRRFYRSPAAYETEGVGIGLYLTRQIVEGQGGCVKVSCQPGRGASFSIYLPRS